MIKTDEPKQKNNMRHHRAKYSYSPPSFKYRVAALALTAAALLSACESPGGTKQEPVLSPVIDEPGQVVTGIGHKLPPSEFSGQFLRAEQSLFEFDWMTAESHLATIPAEQTSVTDDQYLGYMQARIAYIRGDQAKTQRALRALEPTTRDPAIRHKIMRFQRYIYSLSGSYLHSAQLGDQLLRQAGLGAESDTVRRNIWKDLQRVKAAQLRSAMNTTADQQWLGWLELALISRGGPEQKSAVQQWRNSHSLHPAATVLPGGMDYLLDDAVAAGKVALILPLSGRLAPAARAARDGYLAAYYADRTTDRGGSDVEIIDILAFSSVTDAYHSAIAGGAGFVVGPLSKAAVEELGRLPIRTVPVLALNQIDRTLPPSDTALVQLALAPEDEAAQIASLAFGQGARAALIIRPAGAWGNKVGQALKKKWQSLGGKVSATATYSSREDYSNSMSAAMNLPASEQRARGVRSMLATKVEFTPRRRQDLDVVFLLSRSGVEARSLKPLLAYHYASDLPVYAISNIYRGMTDSRDQDLNGINMVEIPWLLGSHAGARAAITSSGTGSNAYTRLNALGADAYLLQSNFSALRAGEELLIRGNTGLLSLTPQLHIHRELERATFDGGKLVAQ